MTEDIKCCQCKGPTDPKNVYVLTNRVDQNLESFACEGCINKILNKNKSDKAKEPVVKKTKRRQRKKV